MDALCRSVEGEKAARSAAKQIGRPEEVGQGSRAAADEERAEGGLAKH